jgi:hypothetical protein
MTDKEAQELIRMVESGWTFDLGDAGRKLWRSTLIEYDCGIATLAIAGPLVRFMETQRHARPTIQDVRQVLNRAAKDANPVTHAIPASRHPEPAWVARWRRARAAGDSRPFPEQADEEGIAELELGSFRDSDVWVQPNEYLEDARPAA